MQWITAYFQHGDLSTRNVSVLEFIQPSIAHVPSVFSMTQAQLDGMTDVAAANTGDTFIVAFAQAALLPIYKKAFYDAGVRAALPRMKMLEFTGDITANFGIVALWQIEDDNTAAGGGFVTSKFLTGTNHFVSLRSRSRRGLRSYRRWADSHYSLFLGPLGQPRSRSDHLP